MFNGSGGRVHTRVRQRMRELYEGSEAPAYLDEKAARFLSEGRMEYADLELSQRCLLDQGSELLVITWMGDPVNEALACLLTAEGLKAAPVRLGVEVGFGDRTLDDIQDVLADLSADELPSTDMLLADAANIQRQKWDWTLSPELLRWSYASLSLDLVGAQEWLKKFAMSLGNSAADRTAN